ELVGDEETADARAVRRDRRILDPGSVRVSEEIVAWLDRLVHPARLDPDIGPLLLLLRGVLACARVAPGKRERGCDDKQKGSLHLKPPGGCFAIAFRYGYASGNGLFD